MEINEKLLKPVMETKYLTVDNADRYRSIARFFYLKYEKLKYWLYQEELREMVYLLRIGGVMTNDRDKRIRAGIYNGFY